MRAPALLSLSLLAAALVAPAALAQQGLRIEPARPWGAGPGLYLDGTRRAPAFTARLEPWSLRRFELERGALRGFALFDAAEALPGAPAWGADAHDGPGSGWGIRLGVGGAAPGGLRSVTLQRAFGNQRLAYTLYFSGTEDGTLAPRHGLRWSYLLGERASVGVSLLHGRGAAGPLAGAESGEARNLALFGRYRISPDWALSAEATSQEQPGLQRNLGLRVGLRHRF